MTKTRTIKVDYLARVEGEGALYIETDGDELRDVKLKIFEPPRYFEAFLRGRKADEAVDITARICGICPVAYQMSAAAALESLTGTAIPRHIQELRRLLYCGEWIESHTLHIYMLHAPDFLGYPDVVTMAKTHGDAVRRGLRLKKAGNSIVSTLGGREVHPINVRLGGFYRLPSTDAITSLIPILEQARLDARATIEWVSQFDFPELERDYVFVALRDDNVYPFTEGKIASSEGLSISADEYDQYFREEHVAHSNALHATLNGKPYLCGPMARYNLNRDRLPASCIAAAESAGLGHQCINPFKSILVRAVEVLFAVEEALAIAKGYQTAQHQPSVEWRPVAGRGCGATEAPRGLLYHRYSTDAAGLIQDCQIVAPTGQNQKTIEADLRAIVRSNLRRPDDELRHLCEQGIRNYDPCISCATHFLKVTINDRQLC